MPQRDLVLLGRTQVSEFGESSQHRQVDVGNPPLANFDAQDQGRHALGDRAQIVLRPGIEFDNAERTTVPLILADEIVLVHQFAVTHHQHGMNVRLGPGCEAGSDTAQRGGDEANRVGGCNFPAVVHRCRRAARGFLGERSERKQQAEQNDDPQGHGSMPSDGQHDLPDMRARLHQPMRLGGLRQRERRVDHR
jgi:hypothetical protein